MIYTQFDTIKTRNLLTNDNNTRNEHETRLGVNIGLLIHQYCSHPSGRQGGNSNDMNSA